MVGGHVVVGVTSTTFKCPPAPSERALLLHHYLTERGLRDRSTISLVMPLGVPIPPSPAASEALLLAFAERGIDWPPGTVDRRSRPREEGRRAQTAFPDVYAVGDVTSVGTPKAGVFSEGEAAVVATQIASRMHAPRRP